MEKMTDAQRAAYMQQGDRMQRMQAAAPTAQQSHNVTTQSRNAQAQAGVVAEMKRITDRWAEIDRLNAEQTQDVAVKCAEITARYAPQIAAVPRSDKQKDGDYYTESEQRAVSRLSIAEFSEKLTLWRNLVSTMQGRIKTKMADVARYNELSAQTMASGGVTAISYMRYQIASDYLDLTESVTILPEVTQSQPNIN
jgi:hypothetical protein